MFKNMKKREAITLIALVITIVVLIILVGIIITLILTNRGIIGKAKTATQEYLNAQSYEQTELSDIVSKLLIASDGTITADAKQLKKIILDVAYPVGSIYITTTDTNPEDTLGGTWEKYAQGKTLIGEGTNGDYTFEVDGEPSETNPKTNPTGEYEHQLTVSEMPSHNHSIANYYDIYYWKGGGGAGTSGSTGWYGGSPSTAIGINSTGGNGAHNNIQPYVTTYMWKRTS